MLELSSVSAYFDDATGSHSVFGPLDIQVSEGETCTIIGPSGCGKTSLLKTIAGLKSYFKGNILMNGESLTPRNFKISYIPYGYGLLSFKTVKDNILLPLKIRNIQINKEVIFLLYYLTNQLNIESILDKYPESLTTWELQSTAIARGLIMKPDVLLMDEPFSNLDLLSRECAQKKLKKVLREFSITTLLVTHSIEEAIYLGNRVIVLSSGTGRIIADITGLSSWDEDRSSARFIKLASILRQLIKEDWRQDGYEKIQNIS